MNSTLLVKMYPIELYHEYLFGKHPDGMIAGEATMIKDAALMVAQGYNHFFNQISKKKLINIFKFFINIISELLLLDSMLSEQVPTSQRGQHKKKLKPNSA